MPTRRPARRAASAAGDRQQQRVARSAGRDAVDEQVVDRAHSTTGSRCVAGQVGQRLELVGGLVVAHADEPAREVVEGALGAGGADGRELGRERKGERHGVEHPRLAWTAKGTIY